MRTGRNDPIPAAVSGSIKEAIGIIAGDEATQQAGAAEKAAAKSSDPAPRTAAPRPQKNPARK